MSTSNFENHAGYMAVIQTPITRAEAVSFNTGAVPGTVDVWVGSGDRRVEFTLSDDDCKLVADVIERRFSASTVQDCSGAHTEHTALAGKVCHDVLVSGPRIDDVRRL